MTDLNHPQPHCLSGRRSFRKILFPKFRITCISCTSLSKHPFSPLNFMPRLRAISLIHFYNFDISMTFFFFFYCCSTTVVPIFPSPLSPVPPTPTSHIQSSPHPVVFVYGSFIHVPWLAPSSSLPCDPPPPSPLVTVSLFFISMSLVLFWLLVCFVD